MKLRKLGWILGLGLAPLYAHALVLGEMIVSSTLNERLKAEVPLQDTESASLDDLNVMLATPDDYQNLGLPYVSDLSLIKVKLNRSANQKAVLILNSEKPVTEPYLVILLKANWGDAGLVRKYTVVFDPDEATPAKTASSEVTTSIAQKKAAKKSALGEAAALLTYGPIKPNEQLWKVAEKIRHDSSMSISQTMLALVQNNPQAFENGNINTLRAGYILKVPPAEKIKKIDPQQAEQMIQQHNLNWESDGSDSESENPISVPLQKTKTSKTGPSLSVGSAVQLPAIQSSNALKQIPPSSYSSSHPGAQADVAMLLPAVPRDLSASHSSAASAHAMPSSGHQTSSPMPVVNSNLENSESNVINQQHMSPELMIAERSLQDARKNNEELERKIRLLEWKVDQLQQSVVDKDKLLLEQEQRLSQYILPPKEQALQKKTMADQERQLLASDPKLNAGHHAKTISSKEGQVPEHWLPWLWALIGLSALTGLVISAVRIIKQRLMRKLRAQLEQTQPIEPKINVSLNESDSIPAPEQAAPRPTAPAAATEPARIATERSQPIESGVTSLLNRAPIESMPPLMVDEPSIDPVEEASVFMGYGRYLQAESVLQRAISQYPQRMDCWVKLLEVYSKTGNRAQFDFTMERLPSDLAHRYPILAAEVVRLQNSFPPAAPISTAPAVNPSNMSIGSSAPIYTPATSTPTISTETTPPAPLTTTSSKSSAEPQTPMVEPASTLSKDDSMATSSPQQSTALTPEPSESISAEPASDPHMLEFEPSSIRFKKPSEASHQPEPITNSALEEENVTFSMESLSLADELIDSETLDATADATVDEETANSHLDLAIAYIDISDIDGARELLEEVLKMGTPAQKARANELLSSL